MVTRLICASLLAAASITPVGAQEPPDCSETFGRQWQARRNHLASLKPSEPGFLPFPYPTSKEQVRADLRDGYMRMRGGENGHPPKLPTEQQLYKMILTNTFDIEMDYVDNWTPGRCIPKREARFEILARVLTVPEREEVARVYLTQEGYLNTWNMSQGLAADLARRWKSQVPNPAEMVPVLAKRLGVHAARARLIHAYMESGRCFLIRPCVLLEGDEGRRILMVPPMPFAPDGELYEFNEFSPRLTGQQARERAAASADLSTGPYPGRPSVSFGADYHIVLTRVEAKVQDRPLRPR